MFAQAFTRFVVASVAALALTGCAVGDNCMAALDMTCSDTGKTWVAPPPLSEGLIYARPGRNPVGVRTVSTEREDGEALIIKAWYPAARGTVTAPVDYPLSLKGHAQQAMEAAPTVRGRAALGALIADGRHPVVVFSHDYALSPEWYVELVQHFASHGFVVLAADHAERDAFAAVDRPIDVRATLDFVEDLAAVGDGWANALDLDRVALVGHAFGASTALAVAGARIDPRVIGEKCGHVETTDPHAIECAPFRGRTGTLDAMPQSTMKDQRVAAIIPISADPWVFGPEGLATVDVPTMAIGNASISEYIASDLRIGVGLADGDRVLASSACVDLEEAEATRDVHAIGCDIAAGHRVEGLEIVLHYATAFLATVFDADPRARQALDARGSVDVRMVDAR